MVEGEGAVRAIRVTAVGIAVSVEIEEEVEDDAGNHARHPPLQPHGDFTLRIEMWTRYGRYAVKSRKRSARGAKHGITCERTGSFRNVLHNAHDLYRITMVLTWPTISQ